MSGSWGQDKRQMQAVALVAIVAVLVAAGVWVAGTLGGGRQITAYFSNASALFEDNFVEVLGVPVGEIDKITPEGGTVRVDMTITDPDLRLPADAKAAVVSPSLVTGRNVTLFPVWKSGPELSDGAVIPIERTAVPLGVDDLTRTATGLSNALGPNGLNQQGALSDALKVLAQNLDGNGQSVNDTIKNLGDLGATLSGSSDDLFGTITELQKFTENLKDNDSTIREFNQRVADVTGTLAAQKENLGGALNELATALDDVTTFVRDNRATLKSNVDKLVDVTTVLVQQRKALTEVLDVAPDALNNLANTYDATTGSLSTRANINELMQPPLFMVCNLLSTGAPSALGDKLKPTCDQLAKVPLPSLQQVLTSVQSGTVPPVPGLALPVDPPSGTAVAGALAPAPAAPSGAPKPAAPTTAPKKSSDGGLLGGLLGGGG